ncbi:hypothetical protein [Herbaspirillum robiniae]|uniref:hypothetical protein n=1 Tax=Herbaspirillum robiniae TaxID=2014887 RepID=UPI003D77AADA
MSEKRVDNTLYRHVASIINRALFLEYAIRAAKDRFPEEMQRLSELDLEIRKTWIELGLREEEIDAEDFMEFAWDFIQVGTTLTHSHGRILRPTLKEIFDRGLPEIFEKFRPVVEKLLIAPAKHYRICDLLKGNNILSLLNDVSQALRDANSYEMDDDIFVSKFIKNVRGPIFLHPAFRHEPIEYDSEGGAGQIGALALIVDFNVPFSELDLKRQFREFQYQYAKQRAIYGNGGMHDLVPHQLINGALYEDFYGFDGEDPIIRHDGFINVLSGLYCYDRFHDIQSARQNSKSKRDDSTDSPLEEAIKETLSLYPDRGVDKSNVNLRGIRKNYETARKRIKEYSFDAVPQLVGDVGKAVDE